MQSHPPRSAPSGRWTPGIISKNIFYGPGCVQEHLLGQLPSSTSGVFIITGSTITNTTPLITNLQNLLGNHHAGTISSIRQHGPVADIDKAASQVLGHNPPIDTLISVGSGSCIDAAKIICFRASERCNRSLQHLSIPTTLSGAECTPAGGYTDANGIKVGFHSPEMRVSTIFYDPQFTAYTPRSLWLSTGVRALDHAVECMYHPLAAEVPWKALALYAAGELYRGLKVASKGELHDSDNETRLMLAVYASSGLKGEIGAGGMGLSHSLGHALGSPYGIPHGMTSCLTLGKVVKFKAEQSFHDAVQIARLLGPFGGEGTGDVKGDALAVAACIEDLVQSLHLNVGGLEDWGVSRKEIDVIVTRALRGMKEGPLFEKVKILVGGMFAQEEHSTEDDQSKGV